MANDALVGWKRLPPDDPNRATMGGDQGPRRADSIVLVRVDPRQERATLLSLPRDLWVEIAGTGQKQRINTAYSRGQQVLADTIQSSLGIPVHHYVEVDFSGFQELCLLYTSPSPRD